MRLVSARWVIPIATPPIEEGAVILDDEPGDPSASASGEPRPGAHQQSRATVLAVGTRRDLQRAHPGLSEWRARGVLCPALVNAHAHLELSGTGGPIPGGDGLVNWTRRLVGQSREAHVGQLAAAAHAAAHAAKACGTVAIGDVGNGTAGWSAMGHAQLEGIFFHELVGSRETRTGDALADAAQERASLVAAERPLGVPAVPAPHAPYSVGPALLRRIFGAAAELGLPTTIHLAEDRDELLLLQEGGGAWPAVLRAMGVNPEERTPRQSPTAYLAALGAFSADRPPLLVHMVHATAEDRRRARDAGSTVVLCPRSNLHIGGKLPDVPALLQDAVRLAIGTDSLASVPNLSLWEEMTTLASAYAEIPPHVWLHAATAGGALALGLNHLGALAAGKRPGILDLGDLGGSDVTDPEKLLVERRDAPLAVSWIDGSEAQLPFLNRSPFSSEVSP